MTAERALLAAVAAMAVSATAAWAPAAAWADTCPSPPSGDHIDFEDVGSFQLRVPAGVDRVTIDARGGHGGQEDRTGAGGRGGVARATVAVTPGECLDVIVGDYGYPDGGSGLGAGGARGTQSLPSAYNGAGGGGASAVLRGSTPLVVAGGGGGGGGQGEFTHYPGGSGGDGAGGGGAGTPGGGDGMTAPLVPIPPITGGTGGAPVLGDHQGQQGEDAQADTPFLGAGGGGGGGAQGGSAGGVFAPASGQDYLRTYGGGGGGGGSSYAAPGAKDVSFTVADAPCPPGGGPAACHGAVSLSWILVPAYVRPYEGSGQSAVITTGFARPLQARVTAADGDPVPEASVTFTLPTTGPDATFDDPVAPKTVTVTTDHNGVATSPTLVAGATGGAWTATARVPDAHATTARFALRNDPATTATAVTASADPSLNGEPVRFTAQVAVAPTSAGVAHGEVEFRVDGTLVGMPVALDGAGVATSDPVDLALGTHQVTAVYGGNRDFEPSHAAATQTVRAGQTTITLDASRNPSPDGDPVTFDAHVTPVAPATGTPTGQVAFTLDGADLGTVGLSGGHATITPPTGDLPIGTHVLVAHYLGSAGFTESSASRAQVVGTGVSATTISSSSNPAAYGEPLTLIAHVTGDIAGTPTGSVDIRIDGTVVCGGVALEANADARCDVPAPLAVGEHDVRASYSGDATFSASEGRAIQRIDRARAIVGVEAVPTPSTFGDAVVLHADVSAQGPSDGTPGGSVQFRVDGRAYGGPVAVGEDGATSPALLPPLSGGPHVIEADYLGSAGFDPARAENVAVVDLAGVAATLSASADPVPAGAPVTLRMALAPQVADSAPHGTVQFRVDGVARGGPVTVQGAQAVSAPIAGLAPGFHDVRGSYSGDDDFAPAEAVLSLPVVVAPPVPGGGGGAAPTTTVTTSPNPSDAGQPVTVTATIAPAADDGTVAFSADGHALDGCAKLTPSAGVAVCRVTGLPPGPHVLRATYSGGPRSGGSSGSVVQTVVGAAAASVSPPQGEAVAPSCTGPVAITSVRIRHGRLQIAGRAPTTLAGRRVTILLHGRSIAHATLHGDGTFRASARRPHGRHWRRARIRARIAGQRSALVPIATRIAVVKRTPMSGGRLRVRARVAGGGRHRVVAQQLAVCAGGARVVDTATTNRRGRVAITLPGAGWYRLRVGHHGPRSLAIVVATPPAR